MLPFPLLFPALSVAVGRHRASRIIPEPFFAHSDLTTGVQIADLVAYVISWGFRTPRMIKPRTPISMYRKRGFVTWAFP